MNMTREDALNTLDLAIRQDRERFFKIADPLILQPKYEVYVTELENMKEDWRNITKLDDYPNINFPIPLPDWFPAWEFMSITKDKTLEELMKPSHKIIELPEDIVTQSRVIQSTVNEL